MYSTRAVLLIVAFMLCAAPAAYSADAKKQESVSGPVSYTKHIRPIFQANCQGCHQPAKPKGGYVMTDFKGMLSGGDSKDKKAAIVPKKPASSLLVEQITPVNGEAEMPKGKPALTEREIELVTRWVKEGAKDDTPASAEGRKQYDAENPPAYTLLPVITSLDFSPDGALLAVAGFHEILLHQADGSGLAARLVGLSERIESVRFSPDGKLLAAAGGQPGRMGEVQVWDVATRKLKVSVPITYDTVNGVSWSPDGTLVAFGCGDLTVRAIEAATGKQVLQQGSHTDWVLDTAFSLKGDHIVSVGRDMSAKLTEVATQRFVDNITSITPGALRGGIHSVARHPTQEQVLVGGADGAPQIYRIFRQTARKIGDNANLIRKFPEMTGRIFCVRYSKDGKLFAAASSLDNTGHVAIYPADLDAAIPAAIKKIMEKTVSDQSAEERKELAAYQGQKAQHAARAEVAGSGVYAIAFNNDGTILAAAGQDGIIRLIQAADGTIAKEFAAAPLTEKGQTRKTSILAATVPAVPGVAPAPIAEMKLAKNSIQSLDVQPPVVKFTRPTDYAQILVTARLANGESADVTRMVSYKAPSIAAISPRGFMIPKRDGKEQLQVSLGSQKVKVPIEISGVASEYKVDFIRDVNPVLTRVGCNAGTCHGAKDGKNGFKLSLRGYDPINDVRAFGDDHASRRVNFASPDDSLMLLKPVAAVPHEGGQRMIPGDKYYEIIRQWIADGARLNMDVPRVAKIEVQPQNPVIQTIGWQQQMRVVATYADGATRDVTADAFIESGNTDVASADGTGIITTLRRGEAPVLARYEGNYAATTVTVMGDRSGFVWKDPPVYGTIDELVAAKWKRMKIQPSELCNDSEFVRRAHLDLTGLPPSAADVTAFIADARETRVKRDELVERLIGSPEFIDHWSNKWADLLMVNRKFLGTEGALLFRDWIRKQIEANAPYDQFARAILTASGSNKDNPPAAYFKTLREPAETMENTTHLFLATRFNCNKCHDHPFERWTQDQYYQTSAFFAQVELKKDPASGDRNIGGTAVEGAKPLYEIVADKSAGEINHLRTGKVSAPKYPFEAKFEAKPGAPRREQLAAWATSPDNRYFAMSYVNRLWGYLTGVGIIEPLDDIRAGNPPSNPELLEHLTREFIAHQFDMRHVLRLICKSRAYQLSIVANEWNADDKINYSHAMARRLPAEVLYDAVFHVTGSTPNFPGVKPGMRAAQLPDSGVDLPSGFLATLGRPPRESACECERSNEIRLGSVMSLMTGPAVSDAIGDAKNGIAALASSEPDDRKLLDAVFMRVLNRHASDAEINAGLKNLGIINDEHLKLAADLAAMEQKFAPVIAEQERQRLAATEKAKTELSDYEKASAPKIAEDERKRQEKIAAAEKALQEHEAALAAKLPEWEKTLTPQQLATSWTLLEAKEAKATGGVKLAKQKDGSYLASGPTPKTDYTFTAELGPREITGVKLEVLPDDSHPKFGPGRAPDGNFVLTEIKLEWSSEGAEKRTAAKFSDARADFSQKDFGVKIAIDDKSDGKGWAISGTPAGQPHQAAFQLEKPVGGGGKPLSLKITLHQKYEDKFNIGRLRLWVTSSPQPLEFGVPAGVAEALKAEAASRSKEQAETLLAYYRAVNVELRKNQQAVVTSKLPLPVDPKLTALKAAVATAEEPVKIEPKLVQLRADAKMSAEQVKNMRLTAAQDLTWALINSSAFLFNH